MITTRATGPAVDLSRRMRHEKWRIDILSFPIVQATKAISLFSSFNPDTHTFRHLVYHIALVAM